MKITNIQQLRDEIWQEYLDGAFEHIGIDPTNDPREDVDDVLEGIGYDMAENWPNIGGEEDITAIDDEYEKGQRDGSNRTYDTDAGNAFYTLGAYNAYQLINKK